MTRYFEYLIKIKLFFQPARFIIDRLQPRLERHPFYCFRLGGGLIQPGPGFHDEASLVRMLTKSVSIRRDDSVSNEDFG